MDAILERGRLLPPATYEDWLSCFYLLKSSPRVDEEIVRTITRGSFEGRGYIAEQFRKRLVETINEMLNRSVTRFLSDLNLLIAFNELSDIVPLFVKLRGEVQACLFFNSFEFLDSGVKGELEQSMRAQMEGFWNDTLAFLHRQTQEHSNADLEDSLLLIRRIRLFAEAV